MVSIRLHARWWTSTSAILLLERRDQARGCPHQSRRAHRMLPDSWTKVQLSLELSAQEHVEVLARERGHGRRAA